MPGVQARRLRAPSWRDPRLVVGLLLVLGSVVGVGLLVRSVDDTAPVYVATRTLTAGQRLTQDDVAVVRARLGAGQQLYLTGTREFPDGAVLVRRVPAGELLPISAIGQRDEVDLRPVTVPLPVQAASGLDPGVLVDVWVAARDDGHTDSFGRPRLVAKGAQVVSHSAGSGGLGVPSGTSIQLLLSPPLVPVVIEAVDNSARITLVPVPATLSQDG